MLPRPKCPASPNFESAHAAEDNSTPSRVPWPLSLVHPLDWLLLAFPVALCAWITAQVGELWVFVASGVAIVPLAGLMGRATESLAATLGAGVGGLLNATFGNAAELIIALIALAQGPEMYPLVKASITGSIIGNMLLVLGLAMRWAGCGIRISISIAPPPAWAPRC